MEDVPNDKVEDENYFSLLDMFICTRLDQYCLMFVLKIINMIHLSETFSFPSAKVLGSRRTSSGFIKSGCISFESKILTSGNSWWISMSNWRRYPGCPSGQSSAPALPSSQGRAGRKVPGIFLIFCPPGPTLPPFWPGTAPRSIRTTRLSPELRRESELLRNLKPTTVEPGLAWRSTKYWGE